jgi:serine/threonine protein kinase
VATTEHLPIARYATESTTGTRAAQRDGTSVFTPREAFVPLGISCAIGAGLILVLARDPMVAYAASGAFAFASVISLLLATVWGRGDSASANARRTVAVAALGASAALPGWFFGPSSAYAGVLAIILLFSGLIMGGIRTPFSDRAAWSVYLCIAVSQALIATLVFTGIMRDASLLPLLPPGATLWHHIACHVTVQVVFAAAFGIGRALHRRYWAVAEDLEIAIRSAARRDALLDEARAEYRRSFALGKTGMFAGHTLGRFRLGELLGRGGQGEVYAARDLVDGTQAAVKVLRTDRIDDAAQVRGFLEEASALTKIKSPHVVTAREVGSISDALPYIAMERLAGTTLAQQLAERGALDRAPLRHLIVDACTALEAVHRAGVIHGDVNPNNLVLSDGVWKLIDFGASLSQRIGTPPFAAPEARAGEPRDLRSDLYGLCATLAVATGRDPANLGTEALDRALAQGLAETPGARPESAPALRDALLGALDEATESVMTAPPRARHAAAPTPAPIVALPPTPTTAAVSRVRPPTLSPTLTAPQIHEVASRAWTGAFADKMRLQYTVVILACIVGAVLIGAIVESMSLRVFAWATIAVAAAVVVSERHRSREWPWIVVGALAIGPAYVLGLHSGFTAVVAVTLFVESSFRSRADGMTGRGWVLAAVLVTQAATFTLITLRVLPDAGVTTVLHHTPWWSAVVIQALVMGVFVTAFAIGHVVYVRYTELVDRNERAARDLAAKEALLATARAEIEGVLQGYEGGLFTGSYIGPYLVEKLIGRGGMGEVYAASRGSERVALKVIRSDRITSEGVLPRFAREAETLRLVDSAYVARVLDVGTEDGRLPFFAMELVEGETLADVLRQRERLDLDEVRSIVRDVCRGLADCHRASVIHRDVKPHNLVLTSDARRWKLVDFGIAKLPDTSHSTGSFVVGTPAYMAPEQLRGDEVDVRADLYSLCLVLYRALAGRPAFAYTRPQRPLPSDPYLLTNLPEDLRHVLRIGLAHAPEARFESALELQAAFEAAFEGRIDPRLRARAERLASDFRAER